MALANFSTKRNSLRPISIPTDQRVGKDHVRSRNKIFIVARGAYHHIGGMQSIFDNKGSPANRNGSTSEKRDLGINRHK
jgi:hypothetical protein